MFDILMEVGSCCRLVKSVHRVGGCLSSWCCHESRHGQCACSGNKLRSYAFISEIMTCVLTPGQFFDCLVCMFAINHFLPPNFKWIFCLFKLTFTQWLYRVRMVYLGVTPPHKIINFFDQWLIPRFL